MGFCPGYRTPEECIKCLNDSRATLTKDCPNQKEAILWNADCTLRYSNRSMYGLMENQPTVLLSVTSEVRGSVEQFNKALESLMRKLTRIAASGDSRRKDATGSEMLQIFKPYSVTRSARLICLRKIALSVWMKLSQKSQIAVGARVGAMF
ncbi:cysteine-rich receptor-like protein kinase 29 [Vigna radiata var. radiata]|uniref:Cysteine-rich receptor-like protein kinase 29 n=1 Tax=Vigna radiata var. radiata TaxID=3916 RepID=A0A1S3V0U5_VIGRR|nr:cysteine-rich receptor-like protein kinase 29 [Vigna radiata var. radiata]